MRDDAVLPLTSFKAILSYSAENPSRKSGKTMSARFASETSKLSKWLFLDGMLVGAHAKFGHGVDEIFALVVWHRDFHGGSVDFKANNCELLTEFLFVLLMGDPQVRPGEKAEQLALPGVGCRTAHSEQSYSRIQNCHRCICLPLELLAPFQQFTWLKSRRCRRAVQMLPLQGRCVRQCRTSRRSSPPATSIRRGIGMR